MGRLTSLMVIGTLLLIVGMAGAAIAADPWDDFNDTLDEAEDAGMFAGLLAGACLIVVIVMWVIFILIAIWVYKDAEKRGANGVLWLIVVILLGLIGLIIYLVVRPKMPAAPPPGYAPPPPGYAPPPPMAPPPQ